MNPAEPSLLSHLSQIRSAALPEGGLTTLIFCGRVSGSGDQADILQVHRKIVEDEVNDEGVNITGILMGQGNSVLHLLEGPSFSVLRILKHLAEHPHFLVGASVQQAGSVVYCVEDRPKRYFPEWYSCTIQERKSQSDEVTEESCKDMVCDLARRLLDIGKNLHRRAEAQEDLDLSRYADQLPGKNLILALSAAGAFFTLEEFVEMYHDPHHVELESELAWPLERLVDYC